MLRESLKLKSVISCLCGAMLAGGPYSLNAAVAPYGVDASTLHLWHLDESAAPSIDAAPGGTNLVSLVSGASLNNASFTGFGTALNTIDGGQNGTASNNRNASFSPRTLANGTGDNVNMAFANSTNGAFTFDAIVRINFNPSLNMGPGPAGNGRDSGLQIISAEGDTAGERLFQWRLNPVGYGGGNATVPRLEFINLRQEVAIQSVIVSIPTNGAHAIVSNGWFHVAVTYNGSENTASNLNFYWTALSSGASSANLIGSDLLVDDLSAGVTPDFVVGNEGRSTASDNFIGLIDEVRISSVARNVSGFLFLADVDSDGLPDVWETNYFPSIATWGAGDDPDNDGFTNLQEYQGGSNPALQASTPNDTDADGLPDSWENTHFGSLGYGAGDDPDSDTFTNLQEYQAGTLPNNGSSNPSDTDADGLPDAWENLHFGSLGFGASDDPDGDGFNNLQEYLEGAQPNNVASFPTVVVPRFYPIEDGNTNTSEYGYAGSSSINTVAFICSALRTVGNQQFIAYYGRHQTDPAYAFNNMIWIGRRTLGSNVWEIFRTTFQANNITDGHDVVCFGIDGDGYMHMSWGMHGDAFHYTRSTNPVTGTLPIGFGPDTTMTGEENTATYPQFFTLPDGDLIYLYRKGTSGAGDTYINRYTRSTQTWTNIHTSGLAAIPYVKGTGWSPDYNCYPNMPCVDTNGTISFIWAWRDTFQYESNFDLNYARSADGGLTWLRFNGTPYALPISAFGENGDTNTTAERIVTIPQNSSLINQAGMGLDQSGHPVVATWWAAGTPTNNFRRQYMIVFRSTNSWEIRQVSQRTNDNPSTIYLDGNVRDLGRPVAVTDKQDRIVVLYRDNANSNGLTIVHSLPKAVDPGRQVWTTMDLTAANLGNYEPVIDLARWENDNVLSILYQPSTGLGYTPPANTASQIGVLEWDAAAYFAHRPSLQITLTNVNHELISFRSQVGWGYRLQASTNLLSWENLTTLAGNGGTLQYLQTNTTAASTFLRLEVKEGGYSP
jgi:hypothetical protein